MRSGKVVIVLSFVIIVCSILCFFVISRKSNNNGDNKSLYGTIAGIIVGVIMNFSASQDAIDTLMNIVNHISVNSGMEIESNYIDDRATSIERTEVEIIISNENLLNDDIVEIVVNNRNDVIYKDSIFFVQIYARKKGDMEWKKEIIAEVGDIIEFQTEYRNSTGDIDAIMVRSVLPTNMDYVDNSTILYNANYPEGIVIKENTVCTDGINIGHYQLYGNAYVRFMAVVVDKTMGEGVNQLITWSSITSGGEALYDKANIYIEKNE